MNMAHVRRLATLLASLLLAARGAAAQEYWPGERWRTSSPEAQGMDSNALADAFDYVREHRIPIHSLLIVRNGYVVLDAGFWPYQAGEPHDLASVTKSVTATLAGIAIGRHELSGVQQPVLAEFGRQDADPRKGRITVEHLLTMTSGLDCHYDHGEITLSQMTHSADWAAFMLDLPMAYEPGAHYEYCSGGMHLLSALVSRATGMSTLDFARRELFGPLGIERVQWPADPQGIQHGWGDLHLLPQDMARIGYLWLHDGRWGERQIVPAQWLRAATDVHSHPGFSEGQEYGYAMWVYPARQPPMYEGLGRGGQRISVVPGANLVAVLTGGGFEPGDVGAFIGRALKSSDPLPPNPAAQARLAAAVQAAAQAPRPGAPGRLPDLAHALSGRVYGIEENPLGLDSLSLSFSRGAATGALTLFLHDRRDGPRPIGLDGVPRLSPAGRFGLPVAVSGAWANDSTFALDYDEVANINDYSIVLQFSGDDMAVTLNERTGLLHDVHFAGKARPAVVGGGAPAARD